jgi:predicted CXXCH cytochrome family protein
MRRGLVVLAMALVVGAIVPLRGVDKAVIINSRHDLRATSTATIKAAGPVGSGEQLCVFCHTPHNSNPGTELWNQTMGTTAFGTYTSSTLQSNVGAVTAQDASKLCLSCHDGTIALGDTVRNGQIAFVQGNAYQLPATSSSNLTGSAGVGFSDDHPFAFAPNLSNLEMQAPPPGDRVKLINGTIQCTSCHNPHSEFADPTEGKFLVKLNQGSALCVSCHQKTGWVGSAHQKPPDPVQDAKYTALQGAHTGYVGVQNNACESCHKPHAPQVNQRLIKFTEENTCFQCHDGNVTNLNVKVEFGKQYKHPVMVTPSVHDDSENPNSAQFPLPETAPGTQRHAECFDCHNSHSSQATPQGYTPQPPKVTPPTLGVKGQSSANTFLAQSANEFEICFKCHADSRNKPQGTAASGAVFGRDPQRQFDVGNPNAFNTRIEFTTGVSSHPVALPGTVSKAEVPSLRSFMVSIGGADATRALSPTSQVYCSDCHNNDTGRQTVDGGTGPSGPHASNFPHLLERSLVMEPLPATQGGASGGLGAYSANNFMLCAKCHDLSVVMSSSSTFPLHAQHMQDGASCDTCHSPHSSGAQMLVNFDTSVTSANPTWTRTAPGQGTCTLSCHGQPHAAAKYP